MKSSSVPLNEVGRRVPSHQVVNDGGTSIVKLPNAQPADQDIEVIPINSKATQIRVKCGCGQTISLICESD